MIRSYLVVAALALCAAACGKSKPASNEQPVKTGDTAQTPRTAPPAMPPQKAAARGPEHAVYSLVDNRLAAHLTRGGGIVVDAGSAGFAKYTRLGNLLKGAKKAWD